MWLEICVAVLVLVVLFQALVLAMLWRQARQLRVALALIGRSATHITTDVPTSMLVAALGRLEHRLGLLELPASSPAQSSYALAQKLARQGADVEQLVVRCGLSPDEARLVVQMHSGAA
ncbi:MAG: DUF2802 domain-containing protein [Xanthomonadales bacterium]|nr:DUF2802 domain-containing protein [Xanthomonadales bacterium]